jgi:hypothetical protein
MTFKRPTLSCGGPRADAPRGLSIPVRCQVGERPVEETWITAIEREYCTVRLASVGVTRTEPLVLHVADEAPIAGRLRWLGQGELGLVFDTPLGEALLERLLALEPPSNVIPLRKAPPR